MPGKRLPPGKRRVVFFAVAFLTLLGLFLAHRFRPAIAGFPVRGIDVSEHQGRIDWEKVRDSAFVSFVFIKATEGRDFRDRRFETNWKHCRDAGFAAGAYHFFTFKSSGKEQASNFIAVVPITHPMLPPVVDLEFGGNSSIRPSPEKIEKELKDFMETVEQRFGMKPILYVTGESYRRIIQRRKAGYTLWYRDIFTFPNLSAESSWVFWQYWNRGRVPGIEGPVDLNAFRGGFEEWGRYITDEYR